MGKQRMFDEGKVLIALSQGSDLDDGDKMIIHMALDALLS